MNSMIRRELRLYVFIGLPILCVIGLFIVFALAARDDDRSPSVLGGGVGGDALTLNSLNSGQFIRSDATDSYTSGTLTTSAGTTVQTEGNFYTKGSPVHNVKAYGAVGDGVADDTVAIQAAIDAAKNILYPGVVFFPQGRYIVSDTLTIDRRVEIVGVGSGSQIYQTADKTLFDFVPYASAACYNSRVESLYVGSAATSAGTALFHCYKVNRSIFRDITLVGSYYGIHLDASLFITVQDITTGVPGFWQGTGDVVNSQAWIYVEPDGGSHSNGNLFLNCNLNFGTWGLYVDGTAGQEYFTWIGGSIENGLNLRGMYIGGCGAFSVYRIHMETAYPTAGIIIENSSNGSIVGGNYQHLVVSKSNRITIQDGAADSITVDKFCRNITVKNVRSPGAISLDGTSVHGEALWDDDDPFYPHPGILPRSIRNVLDGDMEAWAGSLPLGFRSYGTNAVFAEEATIVKFGSKSCHITVNNPGGHGAALVYDLDTDRYTKLDLTNYRSAAYRWIVSVAQPNEYYVEFVGGGDPEILAEPLKHSSKAEGGVLINDLWADKGTSGALAAGEWDYGDNEAPPLGYDTIYVRLGDDSDPDGKASGYVQAMHKVHAITVSCWAYKPETNGGNPGIFQVFNDTGGPTGGYFTIPTDEWTRISKTFYTRPYLTTSQIQIGFRPTFPQNTNVYIDGAEIVEGDVVSPIFDDSRGINGDFRVGGNFLQAGSVSTMAGHEIFTYGDGNVFIKDPGGGARNFNPSGSFPELAEIKLVNTADAAETITFDSAGLNQAVAQFERAIFVFDGTNWLKVYVGS